MTENCKACEIVHVESVEGDMWGGILNFVVVFLEDAVGYP